MFRRQQVLLEFKQDYHRIHLPRRVQLENYKRRQFLKQSTKMQKEEKKARLNPQLDGTNVERPYKYNRWWVSDHSQFVHQYAVVEDPETIRERRTTMPSPTTENVWKTPFNPHMMPFIPFIPVVDYPKDPDVKSLKPINVPRWKDYMTRHGPVVPRTWY